MRLACHRKLWRHGLRHHLCQGTLNDVITRKLGDRVKEKRQSRDETLSDQNRLRNIPQTPHDQNSFLVKEPPPVF